MTKAISENMFELSALGSKLKTKILSEIFKNFRNTEKVHILSILTILDPRFNKICFIDAQG